MNVLLNLDEALTKRIDDYRYENRIPSRSEAMRQLLLRGLGEGSSTVAEMGKRGGEAKRGEGSKGFGSMSAKESKRIRDLALEARKNKSKKVAESS